MLEGLDIVVLCRSGAVGLNKVQIRRKLEQLFDKIAHHNDR
jgi:ribonuclease P protein component